MASGESFCDVCGEAILEGAYFCGECGASVPEFGAPVDTSAQRVSPAAEPTVAPHPETVPVVPQPVATVVQAEAPEPVAPESVLPVPEAPLPPEPEVIVPQVLAPAIVSPAPVASEPVSPQPTPTVRAYMLVFSTGERAQVVGRGLIGRMPVASAGDTWDHLIVVNDPSKTVSKTHLQVEALPEGLLVTDLSSANGTVVSMPGIAAERLAPQERVILTPGATVGIGDQSFTIQ